MTQQFGLANPHPYTKTGVASAGTTSCQARPKSDKLFGARFDSGSAGIVPASFFQSAWLKTLAITIILTIGIPPATLADTSLDKLKERAREALDTTNYDEAVDFFGRLMDKDPSQKAYYLRQRGFGYLGLYRFDLAIADFKAAGPPITPTDEAEASPIPDDSDGSAPDWLKALVLYGAGRKVYRAGNLQQSLMMFEAALTLRPNFPECQSNKAAVLNIFGQRMAAEDLAMQAVSLRPDSSDCWFDLAIIWNRNGKLDKALAAADCALAAMNDGSIPRLEMNPQYQLLMKLKDEINEKQQAKLQQNQRLSY